MANYVKTDYGLINSKLTEKALTTIKEVLQTHSKNTADYNLLCSGDFAKECIKSYQVVMDNSFKDFLKANYAGGAGVRASIVVNILQYLNNEITGTSLSVKVNSEEKKLVCFNTADIKLPRTNLVLEPDNKILNYLERVTDNDFYKLLGCLGPQLMTRLMLTFLGALTYDE